jgi:ATPase family associated with various cellular activities (AAA)
MQGSVRTRRTGSGEVPPAAPGSASAMLGGPSVLRAADVDVGQARERRRQGRLVRLAVVLWVAALAIWWRVLTGGSLNPLDGLLLGPDAMLWLPMVLIVVLIAVVMLLPMLGQGRSPHLTWRPEQIDVGLDDVKGLGPLRDEVTKTLNLFLGYATFKDRLGGNPRRGILFEGKPGTGKTHMAKAMARHAGVPFLFVSATSFPSMWYGMTARKIRAFFKALRRRPARRAGPSASSRRSTPSAAAGAAWRAAATAPSPPAPAGSSTSCWSSSRASTPRRSASGSPAGHRPVRQAPAPLQQHPGHRGHQPGRQPRPGPAAPRPLRPPAPLRPAQRRRPARADRLLPGHQGPPPGAGRRRHAGRAGPHHLRLHPAGEGDGGHPRGRPRRGRVPVGVGRRLEVLSIVKRKDALGLLAHNDTEERWTRIRTELLAFLRIACAGMAAEERSSSTCTGRWSRPSGTRCWSVRS